MRHLVEMVVFARVVEAGGLSAAAQQLGLTTSAVSRSIARLESHLGGQLLNRATRAPSLTELGDTVYAGCATIAKTLGDVEAFAERYVRAPSGHLRVTAPVAYGQACLAPRLTEFMALCPDIEMHLDLSDRAVDLVGESFDVAIRIAATLPPGAGTTRLGSTSSILVASPRYLAQAGTPREPDDLTKHPGVYTDAAADHGELVFERGLDQCRVPVAVRLTINDSAAIVSAVCNHIGIALLPDYAAHSAQRAGHLVRVLPDWALAGANGPQTVCAVYPPTRHPPHKVRAFVDFLVERSDELVPQGPSG
jgi:DNA-binding transcriptional LysR family regulator